MNERWKKIRNNKWTIGAKKCEELETRGSRVYLYMVPKGESRDVSAK